MCDTREEVDVDEVKLNTVLAVKAGEVIPIHRGSFPVTKQVDSVVWVGTVNLNGVNI